MRTLVDFTILLILIIVYLIYKDKVNSEFIWVKSDRDGREYLVRNLPDKVEASNNLSIIREKLVQMVEYLMGNYPKDERVKLLVENFRDDVITEAPQNSKHTSYTINKGDKICFCIRQRNEGNSLHDVNTITFVALHELAHIMTKTVSKDTHDKAFWDNFKFLLHHAIKQGIYIYQPYHLKPEPYCGTIISDTPLKL